MFVWDFIFNSGKKMNERKRHYIQKQNLALVIIIIIVLRARYKKQKKNEDEMRNSQTKKNFNFFTSPLAHSSQQDEKTWRGRGRFFLANYEEG